MINIKIIGTKEEIEQFINDEISPFCNEYCNKNKTCFECNLEYFKTLNIDLIYIDEEKE